MPLYELLADRIRRIEATSFSVAGIQERADLQRLFRAQIDIVSPDTLVVAEEFGDWEDSKRRIDLLGLDKGANLIVIELKRTEDGGHMELQAIRYAAMVSTMTYDKVVEVYSNYLKRIDSDLDANATILDFLGWEEPNEAQFARDVRIVLASAEFSKELTTAVIWLNERGLDIKCIRVKPYGDNGRTLIDVQQIIPLPEAAAYQVQIREKEQKGRADRAERYFIRKKFWEGLLAHARTRTPLHSNISPSEYYWIGTSSGVRGLNYNYVIRQAEGGVELYIDRGQKDTNKHIYDAILLQKKNIELAFGGPLHWERLDGKQACRISNRIDRGGYRDDPSNWPSIHVNLVDAMVRLERALGPVIAQLKLTFRGEVENGSRPT